ncbi:dihydrolipoyl dehydrogenase [Picrophilus oshimae]|uniref:Dihydrolipoamide dehydrogenase n=1 Tax=Picrophilus torridus (strain ATCC 700027 / DSM 9790 / JCM 10055 / NBRC 100828 / KAW 2/3) TaxID=1122961 RepID=Q6L0N0_PICTO|nr:dihydrolipoyl dehydrogenase [Picrophilus oshimae]AAT43472.1 dihydrolipoamide dehydrogenase [Picrophilus oshimae DSM 9789]
MKEYDVVTIGAGGAAYPAAFKLKRSGYNVIMIDKKGVMSGNCLSEGCVPSKAIIESVHKYNTLKGIFDFKVDYKKIVDHKDSVQRLRYSDHDRELGEADLKIIKGTGRLVDENTVEVDTGTGIERYHADNIIIATGADTFIPNIKGSELAVTSRDFYSMDPKIKSVPESITIIGGGYIGVETGSFLSILGSRVTIIEMLDRILESMETDIIDKLIPLLPRMDVKTSSEVKSIEKFNDKLKVLLNDGEVVSDMVMMAAGRHPVLPEGLDDLGIKYTKHGINVNMSMQTNIKNIYATGDVNGITPLFHAAKRQSIIAANNIMSGNVPVDYFDPISVPFTLYTIPQLAYVGILPAQAERLGIEHYEATYDMKKDSLAEINNEVYGEITLVFDKRMKIIGGYVIGNDAGNIINEIALCVSRGLSLRDLAEMSHQHPMSFEGLDSAARKFY